MSFGALTWVATLVVVCLGLGPAEVRAAPMNYGDYVGDSYNFNQVTESAVTPGDSEPLFGEPALPGDILDFDPAGFYATADDLGPDATVGRLEFQVQATGQASISVLRLAASGDYSLAGNTAWDSAEVFYELDLASIEVVEIDGGALATPIALPPASISGDALLPENSGFASHWTLVLDYDVQAALLAEGTSFSQGATRLEITLYNSLYADSDPEAIASIAEKDFHIDPTLVPEPGALAMRGCGAVAIAVLSCLRGGGRRRRFDSVV